VKDKVTALNERGGIAVNLQQKCTHTLFNRLIIKWSSFKWALQEER